MSPENLYCHGALKMEMSTVLNQRIKRENRGRLYSDSTRVVCPAVQLSVEPDLVFVSRASYSGGQIVSVPNARNEEDQFIEFEGAA